MPSTRCASLSGKNALLVLGWIRVSELNARVGDRYPGGTTGTRTAAIQGGTSGIAGDNDRQASSIYFSNLASASDAIKATQSGLN